MTFTPEQIKALEANLSSSHVKTRKMAGRWLSYVEGWHVIAEANRIFGFGGWHSETVLLQETNRDLVELTGDRGSYQQWRIGYIAKVKITAGGVIREGTGYGSGMGKPEAIGDAVEGAIKEAETDARKRALMTFGNPFGLALYDKDQAGVESSSPAPSTSKAAPAPRAPESNIVIPQDQAESDVARTWAADAIKKCNAFSRASDFNVWYTVAVQGAIKRLGDHDKELQNELVAAVSNALDRFNPIGA